MTKLLIDPGHGGRDSGAVSAAGNTEKELVLDVARRVRARLRSDFDVKLTREGDTYPTLHERVEMANDEGRALLSIHANSAENTQAAGFELFTSPGETRSDSWATWIADAVSEAFPQMQMRKDWSDGDPDKEASFHVLRATRGLAVLVELGFLSNVQDDRFMRRDEVRELLAEAIAEGCRMFFGVEEAVSIAMGEADLHDPDEEMDRLDLMVRLKRIAAELVGLADTI